MPQSQRIEDTHGIIWTQTDYEEQSTDENLLYRSQEWQKKWQASLDRLEDIQKLEDNWDNEDAEALDETIIDSAYILLINRYQQQMPPPTRVIPTFDGSISIEWQENGIYLEAEIESPYVAEWMVRTPQGYIRQWDETLPHEVELKQKAEILMPDFNRAG